MSALLFETSVISELIPANVEILLVGLIWPETVLIFVSLFATSVTSEAILATSVTSEAIPATVVMLGKLVDINCLFTE